MDSGLVERVVFTNCMIPLQIDAILPTGEMCYGRNTRVGGDVTMWVFEKECDLAKGWPPILFKGERASDAGKYTILAQEMVPLIRDYLAKARIIHFSERTPAESSLCKDLLIPILFWIFEPVLVLRSKLRT